MNVKSLLVAAGLLVPIITNAGEKKVTVTAYCACKKCCGPNANGITASGKKAVEGVTIAASRSIPFGTKVNIPGVGTRIVQDWLDVRYDDRIDVYMADHNKALNFGKKVLTVSGI